MKNIKQLFFSLALLLIPLAFSLQAQNPPNIVVIVTDDQGYADIEIDMPGFTSEAASYVRSPRIKQLAESSWFFKNAYISGNVCSPTRAGILTGRYQARNGIYVGADGDIGMPKDVLTIPRHIGSNYIKGAFGKWHSGECLLVQDPLSRGFDEYIGYFAKGGHDYFRMTESEYHVNGNTNNPLIPDLNTFALMSGQNFIEINDDDYDDKIPINAEGVYMTELLTYEAVAFIKANANKPKPFFCYLAYTALHTPAQAPQEDLNEFLNFNGGSTGNATRDTLMAMLKILDNGIGDIVDALKAENVFDNTLLIFLTDNGGAVDMQADTGSLRGSKQNNYQGGIKTPFILSWPNAYPTSGQVLETPIISLDIFPTILDAANIISPSEAPLDGKSILPLLEGSTNHHTALYWSEGAERFEDFMFLGSDGKRDRPRSEFAIINGDWKIYTEVDFNTVISNVEFDNVRYDIKLFNIKNDPNEITDLYNANKEGVALELLMQYETWLEQMALPIRGRNAKSFYPPITNNDVVQVYDDVFYQGTMAGISNPGQYNTNSLPFSDNAIRSIVVKRGYVANLYFNNNLEGERITVRGDGKPIFLNGLDKNVSSIEISKGYGPCDGNISLSYSDFDGTDSRRDPVRLIDYNYTYDTGRFLSINNQAIVNFKFCKPIKLHGLGVRFKRPNLNCGFKQTVDIELSNDGGNIWNKVVDNGESINTTEAEIVFAFNTQDATDMRLTFQAFDDGVPDRPEILEVDIKYGAPSLSNNSSISTNTNFLKFWKSEDQMNIESALILKSFQVLTLNGVSVLAKRNINDKKTSFNTTGLSDGIYILKITTKTNKTLYRKIFIH